MTVRIEAQPRQTVRCPNCFRRLSFELTDRGEKYMRDELGSHVLHWYIICVGCSHTIDLGERT